MKRRRYLATALSFSFPSLAACTTSTKNEPPDTKLEDNPAGGKTSTPESLAKRGDPSDICNRHIRPSTQINAILEPAFASDWTGIDISSKYGVSGRLADRLTVIGLQANGQARAYPLTVLTVHEIINDVFGTPLIVTYCPLCRSAIVANRVIETRPTTFHVSGLLWEPPEAFLNLESQPKGGLPENGANQSALLNQSNLVMYDRATGSYWSQIVGRAICGPLKGLALELLPFNISTWAEWQRSHPETEVLLPPPHSSITSTD